MDDVEMDALFLTHERYFWHVLGALARSGYFVPPHDAQDLIHDFYVDEWQGIMQRFDHTQSQLKTYASGAFFRFARRRIISQRNWKYRADNFEQTLERHVTSESPEQVVEREQLLGLIRVGLMRLPFAQRDILYDFLNDPDANERQLAERHAVSRYHVREALLNGIGRVAVQIDLVTLSADEKDIARQLWQEGKSAQRVATLTGRSVPEIQAARLRISQKMLGALRKIHHQPTTGNQHAQPSPHPETSVTGAK